MRKIIGIFLIGIAMPMLNYAQQATDVMRYTRQEITGTARTMGVSNSNGALGGDFGAIQQNPASLGIYRKSEFVFSPGFYLIGSETDVLNSDSASLLNSNSTHLAIDNIGMVFASKLNQRSKNTFNVAIGFNRLAKFNRTFEYSGVTLGSIGTRFAELANGKQPNELNNYREGLAFDAYVIGIEEQGLNYFSDFTDEDLVLKNGEFRSSGGSYEIDLSFASNIDQKLSIGLKLGVPIVSYEEEILYTESDVRELSPFFKRLEYDQYLNTTGTGFNTSLGLIYSPVFPVRFGLTFQSPSWYSMTDDFDSRVFFDYVDNPDIFPTPPPQEVLSPNGRFNYNLTTPWAIRGQAGFILGKNGFISAEVEYLDYANASFSYENGFELAERRINQDIRDIYDEVINIKAGGEYAYEKFRARIGTAFYQSPLKDDNAFSSSFSGGLGYRADNFFLDLTYRWSQDDFNFSPYQRSNPTDAKTTVDLNQNIHHLLLTIGFKL
jgi:hypothetical protein